MAASSYITNRFHWERLLLDSELTKDQKAVGLVIATHISRDIGTCFVSFETLARKSGWSVRQCKTAVKRLVEAEMLGLRSGGGRSRANTYWLSAVPIIGKGAGSAPNEASFRARPAPNKSTKRAGEHHKGARDDRIGAPAAHQQSLEQIDEQNGDDPEIHRITELLAQRMSPSQVFELTRGARVDTAMEERHVESADE